MRLWFSTARLMACSSLLTGCGFVESLGPEGTWKAGQVQKSGSCEYTLVQSSLGYIDGFQRGGVVMLVRNASPDRVADCDYKVELYSGAGQLLDDGSDLNRDLSPGGKDVRCTTEEAYKHVEVSGTELKVTLNGTGRRFVTMPLTATNLDEHRKNLACPGESTKRLF